MTHYIIELALWMLVAYGIGCVIGSLLRGWFGGAEQPATEPAVAETRPAPVAAPVLAPAAPVVGEAVAPEPVEEPAPEPAVLPIRMERPKGLEQAREDKPDDLQRISGIGPKNEKILHTLGFFHFDQLAAWTPEQVAWVDDHLKFNGRIGREHWIEQAQLLADGQDEEFEARFGSRRQAKAD